MNLCITFGMFSSLQAVLDSNGDILCESFRHVLQLRVSLFTMTGAIADFKIILTYMWRTYGVHVAYIWRTYGVHVALTTYARKVTRKQTTCACVRSCVRACVCVCTSVFA